MTSTWTDPAIVSKDDKKYLDRLQCLREQQKRDPLWDTPSRVDRRAMKVLSLRSTADCAKARFEDAWERAHSVYADAEAFRTILEEDKPRLASKKRPRDVTELLEFVDLPRAQIDIHDG